MCPRRQRPAADHVELLLRSDAAGRRDPAVDHLAEDHVAAMVAAGAHVEPTTTPRRSHDMKRSIRLKLVLAGTAAALAATSGLASAGELPDPLQDAVSSAAEPIGVEVPPAEEEVVETPVDEEIPAGEEVPAEDG